MRACVRACVCGRVRACGCVRARVCMHVCACVREIERGTAVVVL